MPMGKLEKRFHEGKGEKHLKTDVSKVRCQGCSHRQLRRVRAERNDPDLSCDDVWPEAQCPLPAVNGTFGCDFHNGVSKNAITTHTSIYDFIPLDMQKIVRTLRDNPELLSRYTEMAQLGGRTAQLWQQLEAGGGGPELWADVWAGVDMIEEGDIGPGVRLIKSSLSDIKHERDIWDEMRENFSLLDKLTRTQFTIEKELRTMATQDQVFSTFETIVDIVMDNINTLVEDKDLASRLRTAISNDIRQAYNLRS